MQAACGYLGVFGFKTYTATPEGYRFLVYLYDAESGSLLSVLQADRLGQLRTGAATAVATKYMARDGAAVVGILGSGHQARTQLEGICQVIEVSNAFVYSPTMDHRKAYAKGMSERLGIEVAPVESPKQAVERAHILVAITSSRIPVFDGHWLQPGTHIVAVGGADQYVTELEGRTFERVGTLVVDDVAQARVECGELILATSEGLVMWEGIRELWQVVDGVVPGRRRRNEITMFKSLGIALWDIAAAKTVYDRAVSQDIGTRL